MTSCSVRPQKEILKGNDYGKTELSLNEDFKQELGDVAFSLLAFANEIVANGGALELLGRR